jgi:hypothetical protein
MCKCACFDWFKKLFGLKKSCCCSSEAKGDVKVVENAPAEPISNVSGNNEATPVASKDPVVETPEEEGKEVFEQK